MTLLTLLQDVASGRRPEEPTAKEFLWSHGVVDNARALECTGILTVSWNGGYVLTPHGQRLLDSATVDGLPHVTRRSFESEVLIVTDATSGPGTSNVVHGWLQAHHDAQAPGVDALLRTQTHHAWVTADGDRGQSLVPLDSLVLLPPR